MPSVKLTNKMMLKMEMLTAFRRLLCSWGYFSVCFFKKRYICI